MNSEFGQPWTAELAALDQFKNLILTRELFKNTCLFSGERSLPFGLLVFEEVIFEFEHIYEQQSILFLLDGPILKVMGSSTDEFDKNVPLGQVRLQLKIVRGIAPVL